MTLYLEGQLEYLLISFFGVGIYFGGLIAYCDTRIKPSISISVMLVGCAVMLFGILLKEFL